MDWQAAAINITASSRFSRPRIFNLLSQLALLIPIAANVEMLKTVDQTNSPRDRNPCQENCQCQDLMLFAAYDIHMNFKGAHLLRATLRKQAPQSIHSQGPTRPASAILARIRFSASAPQYRQSSVIKTDVYGTVIVVFRISTL